jgi:hypothetical protein
MALAPDIRAYYDHVAGLTLESDVHFAELRTLYGDDERLRVPSMVFNIANRKLEAV